MFQSTSGLFYQTYQGLDYIKYSYICNSFLTLMHAIVISKKSWKARVCCCPSVTSAQLDLKMYSLLYNLIPNY